MYKMCISYSLITQTKILFKYVFLIVFQKYFLEVGIYSLPVYLSALFRNRREKTFFRRILCKNNMSDKLNYIKTPLPHLHLPFEKGWKKDRMENMHVCLHRMYYINMIDYLSENKYKNHQMVSQKYSNSKSK